MCELEDEIAELGAEMCDEAQSETRVAYYDPYSSDEEPWTRFEPQEGHTNVDGDDGDNDDNDDDEEEDEEDGEDSEDEDEEDEEDGGASLKEVDEDKTIEPGGAKVKPWIVFQLLSEDDFLLRFRRSSIP